jgi:hypothetical protein
MASLIRYDANLRGMRALARSRSIDADLERRARAVAQVAQGGYDANPPHTGRVDVEVVNDSDSDRARVAVLARHPAALAIEADRRVLGSAIGAARE